MLRRWVVAAVATLSFAPDVRAQAVADTPVSADVPPVAIPSEPGKRRVLGYGRLTTNDLIGDGDDRWRTGSITTSRVWGYGWDGRPPEAFGEILEFRLQGQIVQPEDLVTPNPADRPWAGFFSIGLHTHGSLDQAEYAVGADIVVIGPQTNLDSFQKWLHDLVSAPEPSNAVLAGQIGDKVLPTFVGEIGRNYDLGSRSTLRPYAEARAGDETMLRVGADLTIGNFGIGELMVRESVTGFRYRVVRDPTPGASFLLGADIAKVFDSTYLPSDRGYSLTDHRDRVRAGVQWQGKDASVFYGVTWLGKEFDGQSEDQVVGSLRLQMQF